MRKVDINNFNLINFILISGNRQGQKQSIYTALGFTNLVSNSMGASVLVLLTSYRSLSEVGLK